jgi:DnaJ-class molecular chaperone
MHDGPAALPSHPDQLCAPCEGTGRRHGTTCDRCLGNGVPLTAAEYAARIADTVRVLSAAFTRETCTPSC